jgi:hypothetical protein
MLRIVEPSFVVNGVCASRLRMVMEEDGDR